MNGAKQQVGYQQPPNATRFRKGQSGNPRGRPKNRRREIPYDTVLGQMVTIREDGRERRVTAAEAFLLQLTQKGLAGDSAATRASLDAIEHVVAVEVVPGDLALIVNEFFKSRPRKNRGINIDVFVSRTPFHELAVERDLLIRGEKFWIDKSTVTKDSNQTFGDAAVHYLSYTKDFLEGYGNRDSLVLEMGSNSYCFVSRLRRPHHSKVASNLLMRLYPKTTRAFLTERQMQRIIKAANRRCGYDLRVRAQHYFETTDSRDKSGLEYHRRSVEKLPRVDEEFRIMKNVRRTLDMAKLIAANEKTPLEITFSGDGHIGLYRGDFNNVFLDFIAPIAETSSKRVQRFSLRSMSETDDKKSRPITITFESEPFTDKEGVSALLKHIRDYTHCNYSVVHAGNPHLYMYVMDKIDYSTFSVRSLGSKKLIISPQLKSSAESMARFSDYVLSKFNDGEIAEV